MYYYILYKIYIVSVLELSKHSIRLSFSLSMKLRKF